MLSKSTCIYCGKDFADISKLIGLSVDELMSIHFQFHLRDTINELIDDLEDGHAMYRSTRHLPAYRRLKLMMRKEE
jgi:hypothetical protein